MRHRVILLTALAILALGIALVAVGSAVAVIAVGWALCGIAAVLLVSLVFLLVGESEDRDRIDHPGG